MIFPVACFGCSKRIGRYWNRYLGLLRNGTSKKNALNQLGMTRICCRRMFLSHIEAIDVHLDFQAMQSL